MSSNILDITASFRKLIPSAYSDTEVGEILFTFLSRISTLFFRRFVKKKNVMLETEIQQPRLYCEILPSLRVIILGPHKLIFNVYEWQW